MIHSIKSITLKREGEYPTPLYPSVTAVSEGMTFILAFHPLSTMQLSLHKDTNLINLLQDSLHNKIRHYVSSAIRPILKRNIQ